MLKYLKQELHHIAPLAQTLYIFILELVLQLAQVLSIIFQVKIICYFKLIYLKIATNNNKCMPCDSTCKTCDLGGTSGCLTCNIATPRYFQSSAKTCVTSCNSNQYPNTSLVACKSCDSTCTTCSGAASTNCLSCTLPLYF